MSNNKYLNEENYQRGKKKITTIALIILVIGVLIGGSLIATGLIKQSNVNSQYSEENKTSISEQLEIEKQNLLNKKEELETKISPVESQIKNLEREPFTGFNDAYYARQEKIEELEKSISSDKKTLSAIDSVLENSAFACEFDGKTNSVTSKYCSLSKQLSDVSSDFNKSFDSHDSIKFYIFGAFLIIASGLISFSIFMFTKRREILAFTAQQVMPVAKEGINEIAPTVGNAVKEIAKGITTGINEEKNKKK